MIDDDDLASVLSNVAADARPGTRTKIANSSETRAFLEIGLLLLRDDLLDHRGPDLLDEHDAGTRLFAGLSQARLIERSEREDLVSERPRMLTVGMFRDRWRYKSRYTEDLIAYLMRPASLQETITALRTTLGSLPPGIPLTELTRQMVKVVVAQTFDPMWSMQMIIGMALPNHPRVQTFVKARSEIWLSEWANLYQEVAARYGLQLRPEYTWRDVAELLNTLADGARMRAQGAASLATLSSGESVVVEAVRVLLPGLFVTSTSAAAN